VCKQGQSFVWRVTVLSLFLVHRCRRRGSPPLMRIAAVDTDHRCRRGLPPPMDRRRRHGSPPLTQIVANMDRCYQYRSRRRPPESALRLVERSNGGPIGPPLMSSQIVSLPPKRKIARKAEFHCHMFYLVGRRHHSPPQETAWKTGCD